MVKFLFSLLFIGLCASCQFSGSGELDENSEGEILKGELAFKLISIGSLYGATPLQVSEIERVTDSLRNVSDPGSDEARLPEIFDELKTAGLLYKPYFHLMTDSGNRVRVYTSEDEYERIKPYTLNDLQRNNHKVTLTLRGNYLKENLFVATAILEASEVEGETPWEK